MENSTTTDDDSAQTARSTRRQLMDARLKLDTISTEQPQFGELLAQSLDVVRRALSEFGDHPGGGNLAISFNGGKDACVVLYLLLLVLAERDELGRLWKTSGGKVSSENCSNVRLSPLALLLLAVVLRPSKRHPFLSEHPSAQPAENRPTTPGKWVTINSGDISLSQARHA